MLENIAVLVPAWVFFAVSICLGFVGLLTLIIPFVGLPLILLSFGAYLLAGVARRKAREIGVRRQQGG